MGNMGCFPRMTTRKGEFSETVKLTPLLAHNYYPAGRRWGTADAEFRFVFREKPELPNSFAVKSGTGQNVAMRAPPTLRNSPLTVFVFGLS